MRYPKFSERIITLVPTTPISIYELENLYMATYNLETSPLIHCSNKQKAMVFSTIPGVHVRTISSDHDILGKTCISVVYNNNSYPYYNGMQ